MVDNTQNNEPQGFARVSSQQVIDQLKISTEGLDEFLAGLIEDSSQSEKIKLVSELTAHEKEAIHRYFEKVKELSFRALELVRKSSDQAERDFIQLQISYLSQTIHSFEELASAHLDPTQHRHHNIANQLVKVVRGAELNFLELLKKYNIPIEEKNS